VKKVYLTHLASSKEVAAGSTCLSNKQTALAHTMPISPKGNLTVAFSLAGKEPSHIVKQHKEKNGE
jgi:hypothetical protein